MNGFPSFRSYGIMTDPPSKSEVNLDLWRSALDADRGMRILQERNRSAGRSHAHHERMAEEAGPGSAGAPGLGDVRLGELGDGLRDRHRRVPDLLFQRRLPRA